MARLSGGLRVFPWRVGSNDILVRPPAGGDAANLVGFADVTALIQTLAGAAVPGPAHTTRDKHSPIVHRVGRG